jgi:murein endopeptidase
MLSVVSEVAITLQKLFTSPRRARGGGGRKLAGRGAPDNLASMRAALLYVVSVVLLLGAAAPARADCPFREPIELTEQGEGWHIPRTWSSRGLNYGTASIVGLIQRAAKKVAQVKPGATLYVGDISRREGGKSEWHKSHRCGCDADLLFYAVDAKGKQVAPPREMIPFDARGVGKIGGRTVHFDTARNWALIKAIVQDRVHVERLFIHAALKRRLLAHARKLKESPALIAEADALMIQPRGVGAHDDHLHVRVVPSRKDRVEPVAVKSAKKAPIKRVSVVKRPARRRASDVCDGARHC